MLLRHDAVIHVVMYDDRTGDILERASYPVWPDCMYDPDHTLWSYMYKPLGVYGDGVWRKPSDGTPVTPKIAVHVQGELAEGELCDCKEKCVPCPTSV
jgi:hypothetical protein